MVCSGGRHRNRHRYSLNDPEELLCAPAPKMAPLLHHSATPIQNSVPWEVEMGAAEWLWTGGDRTTVVAGSGGGGGAERRRRRGGRPG